MSRRISGDAASPRRSVTPPASAVLAPPDAMGTMRRHTQRRWRPEMCRAGVDG